MKPDMHNKSAVDRNISFSRPGHTAVSSYLGNWRNRYTKVNIKETSLIVVTLLKLL